MKRTKKHFIQIEACGGRIISGEKPPNPDAGPWVEVSKEKLKELREAGIHPRRWTIKGGVLTTISQEQADALPLRRMAKAEPPRGGWRWIEIAYAVSFLGVGVAIGAYFF